MAVEIRVPPLGESLVDAVVGTWLKQEGDAVSRGESLVELETDKVNLDVTAEEDGVLSRIERREGDVVTVGEVLGVVSASNGATAPAPAGESAAPAAAPRPAAAAAAAPEAPQAPPAAIPSPPPAEVESDGQGGRAAPAVRRLAEEHHVDLNAVVGTGPGGRVTREDVLIVAARQAVQAGPAAALAPTAPPSPAPAPTPAQRHAPDAPPATSPQPVANGREERRRFSRRRQTIAQRLVEAQQTAAMLTTFNEADMSAVMDLRARRKEAFKQRYGVNLGFMSFFTKAVVGALKAFPEMNSELQGDELVLKKYYDIGVAVSTEEGLVVPVIRDADRKTFAEIEQGLAELATKAREGKLSLAEIQGGTFTITNGGVFGSLNSTPILNVPQVGILGMHAIQERPVARNGEVVIRPMMYLAVSYDHRVIDGATAVQFLVKIKQMIEDPETLLIEG
ncbi:MAG: 2-oxoglutarate dehydrogenase complex dihydrolipoyllysine-residue succinyltransferase [Thermomicrobiales bacterium]|nr:2-oxoglutarate dehydrogenase complex dihydrolipoyllysine-residue succinyltransferase [Thermomicrobiales bacterium]